uniref:NADH-ubiquinone oxidoreductase chain 6 n=1 Tax=Euphyllodromia sp. Z257 TaxID=2093493 RepID=A0A2P1HA11_9NEOP|nr:NADH dehydrogenase subunit 6 [Euphyllodromia sp. Z257]
MMMFLSMILSLIFMQINHPLAMGLMMLFQTMLIMMITGLMYHSFWFPYTMFLIFIGGLMVLFIYVTTLASNEMFNLSMKVMFMSMFIFMMYYFLVFKNFKLNNQEMLMFMNSNNILYTPMMKLYNMPTNNITILMASYLFLTLIAVIKIINIFKGPLRKMN